MLGRSDIARHQDRLAPGVFHKTPRLLRILVFVEISDKHIRAFTRIGDCDRPSDAAVRARNHGFFPGELAAAAVALFAMIRLWPHPRSVPRHRLLLARQRWLWLWLLV